MLRDEIEKEKKIIAIKKININFDIRIKWNQML
jgi:hypothetical protein